MMNPPTDNEAAQTAAEEWRLSSRLASASRPRHRGLSRHGFLGMPVLVVLGAALVVGVVSLMWFTTQDFDGPAAAEAAPATGPLAPRAQRATPVANAAADEEEIDLDGARAALDRFMTAFNARDLEAWRDTLHYPHVRLASGEVRYAPTRDDYLPGFDFEEFAEQFGWHHSAWDRVEVVQANPTKVHFAVSFTRYDDRDQPIATYESLYVTTLEGDHWGVLARSSFAP